MITIDKDNVRLHPDGNKAAIKNSLAELGAGRSILLDKDDVLIAGNGVYEQAKAMGLPIRVIETDGSELVAVKRTDLSTDDEKRIALAIADNRLTDLSEFDDEALNKMLDELSPDMQELAGYAIDPNDLMNEGNTDEDEVPEVTEATCKLGELWILGNHRLLCGDSTDKEQVEKLMDGDKADMVFTDPPYNVAGEGKNFAADCSKSMKDLKESEWDKDFNPDETCSLCDEFTKADSTIYIWTSNFLFGQITKACKLWAAFVSYCVWSKPNPMPSLSKRHWTWNTEMCIYATKGSKRTVNFPDGQHALSCWTDTKKSDGTHPTQKPIEVCERPILFSSAVSDLVLDLFLGSGSTLIACEKTNRKCYGMEFDPHYCDVIIKRWEDYTGESAVLDAGAS
jgi:DNA modification methylase